MRTALKHEVYMVRFSPTHRWFSFPDMETNEVLLIKGFDSMEDGRARFTAHAAFEDPTAPSRCDTGVALGVAEKISGQRTGGPELRMADFVSELPPTTVASGSMNGQAPRSPAARIHKEFGQPRKRAYPMPDKAHATAKARAA